MNKKQVNFNIETNTWLSLEDYELPYWIMDYFEDEYLLVKNDNEWDSGWEKVPVLSILVQEDREIFNGEAPWTFEDCHGDYVEVTHFMIIGD